MPAAAHADRSLRSLFAHLFVFRNASTEAGMIETTGVQKAPAPSPRLLLRHLSSRRARTRLLAMDAIAQNGTVSKPLLAELIRAVRDPRADVSRRAVDTLLSLARAGHGDEVVRAFAVAVRRSPAIAPAPATAVVMPTGYGFKVLDAAEEKRARDVLSQAVPQH